MMSSLEIYSTSFEWPGSKRRLAAALAAGRNREQQCNWRTGNPPYSISYPADTPHCHSRDAAGERHRLLMWLAARSPESLHRFGGKS